MPKFSDTTIPWNDYFNRKPRQRYQVTIRRNSLSDYDKKKVAYALSSNSPKDAIERSEHLLKKGELGFFAKEFLNALIISAETDLYLQ